MVCAIGTPRRHPESGIYWFRKRVPERLRARVGRREIKFSLGTRDPAIARLKNLEAILEVERAWAGHDIANAGGEAIQSDLRSAGGVGRGNRLSVTAPPQTKAPAPPDRALPGLRAVFEAYSAEASFRTKRESPLYSSGQLGAGMPRLTKTETTRADGRRALTVYMFPDMVRDLKKASMHDAKGRYAYEIVEEAVRDWLEKNRAGGAGAVGKNK